MIVASQFKAPWFLKNRHLQTLLGTRVGRNAGVVTNRQRIELPDGDFIDIDWLNHDCQQDCPQLLILHGLEGSIESSYIQGLLNHYQHTSWSVGVMHFRGCSGEPNRLPRSYHSGDTEDLDLVLRQLKDNRPLYVAGFSLGGNVLLKYLGEQGDRCLITAAVATSVPFELANAANRLDRGLSRLYRWHLMRDLVAKTRLKKSRFMDHPWPDHERISSYRSFVEFDDEVTAPLHGFVSAEEYYRLCSSRQFLGQIETPTLIIHAQDDPFMTPEAIPEESELSVTVTLELSERGGHMGFLSYQSGRGLYRYIDDRIPQWFEQHYGTHVKQT